MARAFTIKIHSSGEHLLSRETDHMARISSEGASLSAREGGCSDPTEIDRLVCGIRSTDRDKKSSWKKVTVKICRGPTSGGRRVHRGNNRMERGPGSNGTGLNVRARSLGGAFAMNGVSIASDCVEVTRMAFHMELETEKDSRDSNSGRHCLKVEREPKRRRKKILEAKRLRKSLKGCV